MRILMTWLLSFLTVVAVNAQALRNYSMDDIERIRSDRQKDYRLGFLDKEMWNLPYGGFDQYYEFVDSKFSPLVADTLNTILDARNLQINITDVSRRLSHLNLSRRPEHAILWTTFATQFIGGPSAKRFLISIPQPENGLDLTLNFTISNPRRLPNGDLVFSSEEFFGVAVAQFGPSGRSTAKTGSYFFDFDPNTLRGFRGKGSLANCVLCHSIGHKVIRPLPYSVDFTTNTFGSLKTIDQINERLLRAPKGGPFGSDFAPASLRFKKLLKNPACTNCHNSKWDLELNMESLGVTHVYTFVERGYMPKLSENDFSPAGVRGYYLDRSLEEEFGKFASISLPNDLRDAILFSITGGRRLTTSPELRLSNMMEIVVMIKDPALRERLRQFVDRMRLQIPRVDPNLVESIRSELDPLR